jgi:predicted metalloendopeptidase
MTNLDRTIRPQDDFYGYVNNDWIKNNPIPAEENIWGNFFTLRDKSCSAINEIIKDILDSKPISQNDNSKLLKTFFESGVNYSKYRQNHLDTLKLEIDKINNITNKQQLPQYLGYMHQVIGSFWNSFVTIDDKDSQNQLLFFSQGGLTLPNRDYYLEKTKDMKTIREKYNTFFDLANKYIPNYIPDNFKDILKIENIIAKSSWTEAKLRDVNKNYNK